MEAKEASMWEVPCGPTKVGSWEGGFRQVRLLWRAKPSNISPNLECLGPHR